MKINLRKERINVSHRKQKSLGSFDIASKDKSAGTIGFSKHRKAFGKSNRNATNNLQVVREMDELQQQKKRLLDKRKNPMFPSVLDAIRNKNKP